MQIESIHEGGYSHNLFIPEKEPRKCNYPLQISGWIITNQTNLGIIIQIIRRIFLQPDIPNSYHLQNRFKIILFILQWPTNKTATQRNFQNRIKQRLTEKIDTTLKNIGNRPSTGQLKTHTIELSKVEENAVVPEPTQEELWTSKNEDEEYFKDWKQKYNQIHEVKSYKSLRTHPQVRVWEMAKH